MGDVARLIISNGQASSSIERAVTTNRDVPAAAGVERGGVIATAHSVNAVSGALQYIDSGEIRPDVINRVATSMGITPEEVSGRFEHVRAAFEQQAAKAVGSQAEKVFAWAREHAMKDLREAARMQAFEGRTNGYKELARKYIETLPEHSPHLIFGSADAEARGIRKERDGTITVAHPKLGRVAWRDAVRAGFIKPHLL